ncbi:MAG: BMC domain-containing protein [Acidobacteriota bacterium]
MSNPKIIGALELSSVGIGYKVLDQMLKAAAVEIILARTICSGKYLIILGGKVSDVESAMAAGREAGEGALIDELVLTSVHPSVFPALGQSVSITEEQLGALGIVESFSGVSILAAADAAAKAAAVTLFRVHVAMALGGKGFLLLTGEQADVEAAVSAAVDEVAKRGLLVSQVVIPRPEPSLISEYI